MKFSILLCAALLAMAGCASVPASVPTSAAVPAEKSLHQIAESYVRLQLEIGEHEPGYIDAYYGPPEWAAAAKANKRSLAELAGAVAANRAALAALRIRARGDALWVKRVAFLDAQMVAAQTRLRMLQGEKLTFVEEARGLFGVEVAPEPLASFDPVLAEIERVAPGPGPLWQRVDQLNAATHIAPERLRPVFDRAIAECRARTLAHIALPPGEAFALEFVTGKSWGGYNWYQGGYRSLIQVNTDLPVRAERAVDLGCHEGYPGHHVLNALLEQRLTRGRGWIEFSVYPLYSPQSLIAEGSANYGIELAFPGGDKAAFERAAIYPLAGLGPALAERTARLGALTKQLARAQNTIAQAYLDGALDRPAALAALQKYRLASPARAEQSLKFIEQYRSYVINYNLGLDLTRAYVERVGGSDPAARWKAFEAVISEPTLPIDLVG
ncbi:MAG: hypothetical protein LC648_03145 [Novosphingobium sp.]|nr:hypothetical protein [Novosphingobium sp.]